MLSESAFAVTAVASKTNVPPRIERVEPPAVAVGSMSVMSRNASSSSPWNTVALFVEFASSTNAPLRTTMLPCAPVALPVGPLRASVACVVSAV